MSPALSRDPVQSSVVDRDGVPITIWNWDVEQPLARIHLIHGVGEHARRYARVIADLNDAGFSVSADDHRGHGETGLRTSGLTNLGPRGIRGATDAVQRVGEHLVESATGLPVIAVAHSWGSFMAQKIVARSYVYDALVLSGSTLATLSNMNISNLNARWDGPNARGSEWVSRDEQTQSQFVTDPLCFDFETSGVFGKLEPIALLGRPPRHLPRTIPIYIQGGSEDPIGGRSGLSELYNAYRERSGVTDIELAIYEGARHEVYFETNRDETVADLVAWLTKRFGTEAEGRARSAR